MRKTARVAPEEGSGTIGLQEFDDDDDLLDVKDFSNPPSSTSPTEVLISFGCSYLDKIDTTASTAYVYVYINLEWNDQRLAKWPKGKALPEDLWKPVLEASNAVDTETKEYDVRFKDREHGTMVHGIQFKGTISNPMNLKEFPLDVDCVLLNLVGFGMKCFANRMTLVPHPDKKRRALIEWGGYVSEWQLLGTHVRSSVFVTGAKDRIVQAELGFWVQRKTGYYLYKVVFMLWFIVILALSTYSLEIEDLPNRLNQMITMFLTASAMLFVVDGLLPKTDFLTRIDKLIFCTMLVLVLLTGGFVTTEYVSSTDVKAANLIDSVMWMAMISLYGLFNMYLFLGPVIRRCRFDPHKDQPDLFKSSPQYQPSWWPNTFPVEYVPHVPSKSDNIMGIGS